MGAEDSKLCQVTGITEEHKTTEVGGNEHR